MSFDILARTDQVDSGNVGAVDFSYVKQPLNVQTWLSESELATYGLGILAPPHSETASLMVGGQLYHTSNMSIMFAFDKILNNVRDTIPEGEFSEKSLFDQRVAEIREIARDENLVFSDLSLRFANGFLQNYPNVRLPSVFLVGNGNIRLVWDKGGERVGLQFLEDGKVQFVFLQNIDNHVSEIMGTCPAAHILRLIARNGLRAVIMP